MKLDKNQRYHLLDILRGIAAFAVLIWHYQHFFTLNEARATFSISSQPFFWLLKPFYTYGHIAVYMFFSLSGFVFFSTYAERIQSKTIGFFKFAINRISRLYPLHLLTLIIVALLQGAYVFKYGTFYIYPYNDLKHYILNIFFISHWGFENGYSFNGPIWSVSLEVLLYLIFFVFLSVTRVNNWKILIFAIAGLAIGGTLNHQLGVSIWAFFTGGLIYYLTVSFTETKRLSTASKIKLVTLVSLFGLGLYSAATFFLEKQFLILLSTISISPVLIFTLAYLQHIRPKAGQGLTLIGDMTYSSYLIHFPIQLIIQIIRQEFGIFYPEDNITFLAYITLTYCISYFIYFKFELPAKNLIRSLGKRDCHKL